jgi:hypothetical protein
MQAPRRDLKPLLRLGFARALCVPLKARLASPTNFYARDFDGRKVLRLCRSDLP